MQRRGRGLCGDKEARDRLAPTSWALDVGIRVGMTGCGGIWADDRAGLGIGDRNQGLLLDVWRPRSLTGTVLCGDSVAQAPLCHVGWQHWWLRELGSPCAAFSVLPLQSPAGEGTGSP